MKYGSVCSGIEAATMAWHPLGWEPAFFSEIEPFPSAVLAHHYPNVPNYGDMTKFKEWPNHAIDLLVGGTPCQSFSIAGLRKGLADPRGNLMLTFGAVAQRYRPTWLVWENVPGVLSSNGGRDFGTFLGMLGQLGYGFAYRVLDAQYVRTCRHPAAVPQKRRRVFVVGHLGDWRRAAAVLFDAESLSGNTPPRRETEQGVAPCLAARTRGGGGLGTDAELDGALVPSHDPACTLTARERKGALPEADLSTVVAIQEHTISENPNAGPGGKGVREDGAAYTLEARQTPQAVAFAQNQLGEVRTSDAAFPITTGGGKPGQGYPAVAHTLKAEGHDASEDGTGRGVPMVPVAFDCKGTQVQYTDDGSHPTLRSMGNNNSHPNAGGHAAVAFDMRGRDEGSQLEGPHDTAALRAADGGSSRSYVAEPWAVRRLTPVECERLQGFPDDFTRIPGASKGGWRDVDEVEDIEELRELGLPLKQKGNQWRVKDPDGPRYKALGNSMAVNVMQWLGERIAFVAGLS